MQALVFVKDIGNLSVYAEKLAYHHVDVGVLHSEAKKLERANILKAFEAGEFNLLLATDIAARHRHSACHMSFMPICRMKKAISTAREERVEPEAKERSSAL